jgi:hypothetical protein
VPLCLGGSKQFFALENYGTQRHRDTGAQRYFHAVLSQAKLIELYRWQGLCGVLCLGMFLFFSLCLGAFVSWWFKTILYH